MPAAMITDVTGISAFDVIGCTDEPESNVYHVALATDDQSGLLDLVGMRFSCVGLVYEAYLFAGIKLISDLNNLPEMSKEALLAIWPLDDRIVARLEHELGPLPWRPLMPGYVVHAFDATARPYTPTIADLRFPRLSTAAPEGDDPGEPTTDAAMTSRSPRAGRERSTATVHELLDDARSSPTERARVAGEQVGDL